MRHSNSALRVIPTIIFLLIPFIRPIGAAAQQTSSVKSSTAAPATARATTVTTPVLTTEGVVGDVDKDHRGPKLSVSTVIGQNVVQILADAEMINTQYAKYPLQFDFYINRHLFSSQLRSVELPGPIGVDIGTDIATPPFNYTVVAKVLHPNREFTTVIQGAVYSVDYTTTFSSCTVTTISSSADLDEEDVTTVYTANNVVMTQSTPGNVGMSFTASNSDSNTVVDATLEISGTEVAGTVSTTGMGVMDVAGSVTLPPSGTIQGVSSLSVEGVDGMVSLNCS